MSTTNASAGKRKTTEATSSEGASAKRHRAKSKEGCSVKESRTVSTRGECEVESPRREQDPSTGKNYEDLVPGSFDDCAMSPNATELRLALTVDSPGTSILVSGPPGTGKTLMTTLACQENGIHMLDFSAMDVFDMARKKRDLKLAISTPASLRGGKVAVFIHSVVGSFGKGVRHDEFLTYVISLLKDCPAHACVLVVEADEQATRPIKQLAGLAKHNIRFFKPSMKEMFGYALRLNEKQQLRLSRDKIVDAVQASQHDYRQLLNNVCLLTLKPDADLFSSNATAGNVFTETEALLRTKLKPAAQSDYENAIDGNPRLYLNMVHENYPSIIGSKNIPAMPKLDLHKQKEVKRAGAMSEFADHLSDADLLTNWESEHSTGRVGSDMSLQTPTS